jgi:hypothetical protein
LKYLHNLKHFYLYTLHQKHEPHHKLLLDCVYLQKTVEIPTNIVKQPENANMGDLQHRASKITGLIMSNRLSDRFKQGDESIMQMMARIQSEITTDAIADQWENKLEEFGVVF